MKGYEESYTNHSELFVFFKKVSWVISVQVDIIFLYLPAAICEPIFISSSLQFFPYSFVQLFHLRLFNLTENQELGFCKVASRILLWSPEHRAIGSIFDLAGSFELIETTDFTFLGVWDLFFPNLIFKYKIKTHVLIKK